MKRPLNRDADRMRRHNRLMKSYRLTGDRRQLKRALRLRRDVNTATLRRLGEAINRNLLPAFINASAAIGKLAERLSTGPHSTIIFPRNLPPDMIDELRAPRS